MQELTPLDPAERELEQTLETLEPRTILEQEIWYRAGLEAGGRRARGWQCVAAAFILLSTALVVWRPKSPGATVERVVYVAAPQVAVQIASSDETSTTMPAATRYFQLRDAIEQRGLEALPAGGGAGVLDQPVVHAWSGSLAAETEINRESL